MGGTLAQGRGEPFRALHPDDFLRRAFDGRGGEAFEGSADRRCAFERNPDAQGDQDCRSVFGDDRQLKKKLESDAQWRFAVTVSRDAFGKHPYQLSPDEEVMLADFMALRMIEIEAEKRAMARG